MNLTDIYSRDKAGMRTVQKRTKKWGKNKPKEKEKLNKTKQTIIQTNKQTAQDKEHAVNRRGFEDPWFHGQGPRVKLRSSFSSLRSLLITFC